MQVNRHRHILPHINQKLQINNLYPLSSKVIKRLNVYANVFISRTFLKR